MLLANMLQLSFGNDFCLVYTEFWAGGLANFVTRHHAVSPSLFSLLSLLIRMDHGVIESNPHLPHTWLFVFLFYSVSKHGLKLELSVVKDCSFTAWFFIGVLPVIYFLGPRLKVCLIAAACSATSSSDLCFFKPPARIHFSEAVLHSVLL